MGEVRAALTASWLVTFLSLISHRETQSIWISFTITTRKFSSKQLLPPVLPARRPCHAGPRLLPIRAGATPGVQPARRQWNATGLHSNKTVEGYALTLKEDTGRLCAYTQRRQWNATRLHSKKRPACSSNRIVSGPLPPPPQ